ncbi:uncharacterized protein LOC144660250 [Oculina patagonica]
MAGSPCEYEPMKVSLGTLPEFHEEMKSYDLKVGGQVPAEAKKVFVYTFVTTNGEGDFQRGYYEISTSKGGKQYTQYMNVATGQGVKAVNSANMWLPMGDGKLTVKLVHAEGKKSIASGEHKDWSELFVIGYKC